MAKSCLSCMLGTELQSVSCLSSSNSGFLNAHSNSPVDMSPIPFNVRLYICRLVMCWVEIETFSCDLLAFFEVENLDLLTNQLFPMWVNKATYGTFRVLLPSGTRVDSFLRPGSCCFCLISQSESQAFRNYWLHATFIFHFAKWFLWSVICIAGWLLIPKSVFW